MSKPQSGNKIKKNLSLSQLSIDRLKMLAVELEISDSAVVAQLIRDAYEKLPNSKKLNDLVIRAAKAKAAKKRAANRKT